MTPEELYDVWAPPDSIWSQWVIPVPFAQIVCLDTEREKSLEIFPDLNGLRFDSDLAVIVDLPGGDSIRYGLALARLGFRPVAVLDGSPGPFTVAGPMPHGAQGGIGQAKATAVVDMRDLLFALCAIAPVLQETPIVSNAPPAFLLDSQRMKGDHVSDADLFDNRWKVFPQDFPSAKFLREQGVRRVLLIQESAAQPQEDLAHVLLRWQEAGLEVLASGRTGGNEASAIRVAKPSRFRASWYRGLEILGLRRNSVGGFGGWPYEGLSG
jgi:hypothetical protein